MAQGTPEQVAKTSTWTGKFLRPMLAKGREGSFKKAREKGERKVEVAVAATSRKRARRLRPGK